MNDPRLPMDQSERIIRQNADGELSASQRVVECPIPRNRTGRRLLGLPRAPTATQRRLSRARRRQIPGIALAIADDPDRPLDGRQRLTRHLEQAAPKIARDAVVANRAGQPLLKHLLVQTHAPTGVSFEHGQESD